MNSATRNDAGNSLENRRQKRRVTYGDKRSESTDTVMRMPNHGEWDVVLKECKDT